MKRDPLTNEEFIPKTISQRFAKPENRIKFHNLNAKKLRHKLSYIQKPLHINQKILSEIMIDKNECIFHRQYLLGKGFDFKVHNHVNEFNGKNHYAIYNYTLIYLGNEQVKILIND